MAIKPPTKPADGDEVAISFFTDMYDENETYLNKAIKSDTDFVTGNTGAYPVVKTRHIYKPEFYESASRRTMAVSSETYYRNVPFGVENLSFHHPIAGSKTLDSVTEQNAESGWTPVRNMGATFTVEESSTPSTILCSFYAYEMGGALSAWGEGQVDNFGNNPGRLEETWCAEFALFVNGERVTATERYLYASTSWQHMHARKQFSFIATPTFSAGVNHVVVMCLVRSLAASPKPDASSATPRQIRFLDGYARSDVKPTFNAPGWKHIMVGGRSMVIDIHAL
tara:strand:+ start:341 stop:1186 length:846 start_codon:yes stop_codon:yes gene_type:complete